MSMEDRLYELAKKNIKLLDLCVKGLVEKSMTKQDYAEIKKLAKDIQALTEGLP